MLGVWNVYDANLQMSKSTGRYLYAIQNNSFEKQKMKFYEIEKKIIETKVCYVCF